MPGGFKLDSLLLDAVARQLSAIVEIRNALVP